MKKQKTLEFLVNNLEQWPTRLGGAPVVEGYTWTKGVGGIILFDNDAMQCESMEQMVIEKKEWLLKKKNTENASVLYNALVEAFNIPDKPKQKIYVCGPMTGYDNFNRPAFNDAASWLSMSGYIVLSPAILPDGLTQAEYMQIDLTMLQCCDSIYMLNGWDDSAGAMAEHALAMKLGLEVIHDGDLCQE